jgi:hypothetical protein
MGRHPEVPVAMPAAPDRSGAGAGGTRDIRGTAHANLGRRRHSRRSTARMRPWP